MTEDLPISQLDLSGATQPRAGLRQDVIDDYAADMRRGDRFPPVVVFYDGERYWLADGFHRTHATRQAGRERIEADIRQGTRADAQWYSYSVNGSHGARRTSEDKGRQVRGALLHPNGAALSDRQIAAHVGVDHKTVARSRAQLEVTGEIPQSATRTGADGRTIKVTSIGGRHAPSQPAEVLEPAEMTDPVRPEAQPAADRAPAIVDMRPGRAVAFAPWATGEPAIVPTAAAMPVAQVLTVGPYEQAADREAPAQLGCAVRRWLGAHYPPGNPWVEILDHIVAGVDGGPRALDAMSLSPFIPQPRDRDRLIAGCRQLLAELQANPVQPLHPVSPAIVGPVAGRQVAIYNQDARRLAEVIAPGSVHLVITSPPYNAGIDYGTHDDAMPQDEYLQLLRDVFAACHTVMAPGARICVNVAFGIGRHPWYPLADYVRQELDRAGFTLRGQIVWSKDTTGNRTSWGSWRLPSDPSLRDSTECILVAHKGPSHLSIPAEVLCHDEQGRAYSPWLADGDLFMRLARDLWTIAPESAGVVGHPAPFPVALPERLLRLYGYPGCLALDPFAGAGAVGLAAIQLGCQALLFDVDPQYCALAKERCERELANQRQ
jgi:modification methylase